MSSLRLLAWLVPLPFLAGCNAELGARAGATWPNPLTPRAQDPHFTWVGHTAAHIVYDPKGRVFNRNGILIGGELQGRAEAIRGSRFITGLTLGYARQPERRPGAFGWEFHADVGTPIRKLTLFSDGSFYAGGTVAIAWWISGRHELADLNVGQWLLSNAAEIVFFASSRAHFDHPYGAGRDLRVEAMAGGAIRLRFLSDLF